MKILEKFGMANCKPKFILFLVKVFLSKNNLFTNKKETIEMRKVSHYKVLKLLI